MLIPQAARLANSEQKKRDENWGDSDYNTFLKLRSTATPASVTAKINGIMHRYLPDANDKISLVPLLEIHFETDVTSDRSTRHGDPRSVYIFSILGVFLLLIACINYVNLTTARASLRAKEVGIRKIIGAGKRGLFFQFMLDRSMLLLESDEAHGAPAPHRDCCLHNPSLPFSVPKELWQPVVHNGMGRRAHASFNKLNILRGVYLRREFAGRCSLTLTL